MPKLGLAISGGIAAYKMPEFVRQFKKNDYSVTCVLSQSAEKFVSATALEVVSEQRVFKQSDQFNSHSFHLSIAKSCDVLLVAPATANTIAKIAYGIADSLLTSLVLSFQGSIIIAPAMHTEMWENEATKENVKRIKNRGIYIVEPEKGDLACGDYGVGRLASFEVLLQAVQFTLRDRLPLKYKQIVVTAGGTSVDIDPVRYIANRSSGQLGLAIAERAFFEGANVQLITTKKPSYTPGFSMKLVKTGQQLDITLSQAMKTANCLFMAAAVSDFEIETSNKKLERIKQSNLNLKASKDILAGLEKHPNKRYIGFCLADDNLEEKSLAKLKHKGVNYIIGNGSASFGSTNRSIEIFSENGKEATYTNVSVLEAAEAILKLAC